MKRFLFTLAVIAGFLFAPNGASATQLVVRGTVSDTEVNLKERVDQVTFRQTLTPENPTETIIIPGLFEVFLDADFAQPNQVTIAYDIKGMEATSGSVTIPDGSFYVSYRGPGSDGQNVQLDSLTIPDDNASVTPLIDVGAETLIDPHFVIYGLKYLDETATGLLFADHPTAMLEIGPIMGTVTGHFPGEDGVLFTYDLTVAGSEIKGSQWKREGVYRFWYSHELSLLPTHLSNPETIQ